MTQLSVTELINENQSLETQLKACQDKLNPPRTQPYTNTTSSEFSPPKMNFGDLIKNTKLKPTEENNNNKEKTKLEVDIKNKLNVMGVNLNKLDSVQRKEPTPTKQPEWAVARLKTVNPLLGGKKRTNKKNIRSQKKSGGGRSRSSKKRKHKKSRK